MIILAQNEESARIDEVNRQIVQRLKTLIVINSKIANLEKLRTEQQAEIDRLMKLIE